MFRGYLCLFRYIFSQLHGDKSVYLLLMLGLRYYLRTYMPSALTSVILSCGKMYIIWHPRYIYLNYF